MKLRFTIAAAALGLVASAQAQVTLSTPELTLTTLLESEAFNTGPHQFSVQSGGGVTRIGMTSLATLMNIAADNQVGVSSGEYHADFQTVVQAGYRVTGYSFDSTVVGTLVAPPLPAGSGSNNFDQPSIASNLAIARVSSAASYGGTSFDSATTGASTLSGARPLHLASAQGLSLTGSFILGVVSSVYAFASDGAYRDPAGNQIVFLPASASIRFVDPVLTIYTQPVPEPANVVLLSAGLVVFVAVVRRRNRLRA